MNNNEIQNDHFRALVSIIIPVYKVEKYLAQCVDSVIGQTYKNLEIILVDDGSPDNCPKMCDEQALMDNRIVVIHQKNGGLSFARNQGIKIARGDYLFFLDSDDYLDADAIRIMLEACETNDSDFCFCDASSFLDAEDSSNNFKITNYARFKDYGTDLSSNMALKLMANHEYKTSAALLFIKAGLLKKNNLVFYNGILHEDNLFTASVFLYAEKCTHVHKSLYKRRVHSESITTREFNEKNFYGYYICIIELFKLLNAKIDRDKTFLIRFIKTLCFAINNKYYNFSQEKRKNVKIQYINIHRLLKNNRYLGDYKLFCAYNFPNLVSLYRKYKGKG